MFFGCIFVALCYLVHDMSDMEAITSYGHIFLNMLNFKVYQHICNWAYLFAFFSRSEKIPLICKSKNSIKITKKSYSFQQRTKFFSQGSDYKN